MLIQRAEIHNAINKDDQYQKLEINLFDFYKTLAIKSDMLFSVCSVDCNLKQPSDQEVFASSDDTSLKHTKLKFAA